MQSATAEKTAERVAVKRTDHAILYSDGTILVKEVRASYPHLFKPFKGPDGGTGKYGIVGLMPKKPAYFPAKDLIRDYILSVIRENKLKDLPAAAKFLRDGDAAARQEYVGMYTINASESRAPAIRDSTRDPKTRLPRVLKADNVDDTDIIYAGCWVNILIRPWFQNNNFGKKVNAGLVGVQFCRDDEPFGTGRISESAIDQTFDEYAEDDSGYEDDLGASAPFDL